VDFAGPGPPVGYAQMECIGGPCGVTWFATSRTDEQVYEGISADGLIDQGLADLVKVVKGNSGNIEQFDCSCFDGAYITGDIDEAYLDRIEARRGDENIQKRPPNSITQLDLNLPDQNVA